MKTYKVIFVAFAVMVLGVFVITSCSNEEEQTTPNKYNLREMDSSIEDLKNEWRVISSSEGYLEFLSSVDTFSLKLPQEAIPYLDSRDSMLSWIEANISLTDFNSFIEAENELNAVEGRYLEIMVANEGFFRDVSLIDYSYRDTDIFLPLPFQPQTPVISRGPCENECINDAVACGRAVDNAYRDRMDAAQMLIRMGLFQAAAVVSAVATIAQHAGQRGCVNALDGCMEAC